MTSWWNNLWNLRAPCAHSWAATEAHLDPCNFTTCRTFRLWENTGVIGLGKIYRKPMGNPWETHGKPMGNPWETHGKPMVFFPLIGVSCTIWREDLTICSWCSLSWHVITSAHQKGRNQIQPAVLLGCHVYPKNPRVDHCPHSSWHKLRVNPTNLGFRPNFHIELVINPIWHVPPIIDD